MALLLIVAAAGYAAYSMLAPSAREVRVWTVVSGDLDIHFLAAGEVTVRRAAVSAPDWAMIRAVKVADNEKVHRGQLLVTLDGSGMRTRFYNARSAYDSARGRVLEANHYRTQRAAQLAAAVKKSQAEERGAVARLAALRAGPRADDVRNAQANLAGVRAQFEGARRERKRLETQAKTGNVPPDQFDKARTAEKVAQAQLHEAEGKLRLVSGGPTHEAVTAAQAEVDQKRAGVEEAQKALLELSVLEDRVTAANLELRTRAQELRDADEALQAALLRSPVDGVVAQILMHAGERAGPGQPIVVVVASTPPWIEVNVDEHDAASVKLGQAVSVRVAALPGRTLPGKVTWVAAALETPPHAPGNAKFLRIKVDLDEKVEGLRAGMAADVEGKTVLATNTLILPRSAVQQAADGPYVIGYDNGRALRVPVRLGVMTAEYVQELKGPAAGMKVVQEGAERLSGGERLRIVP